MPNAPEMPLDIRELMRDCILAIIWPKSKIIEFFQSVDCPAESLLFQDQNISRHAIVTEVFARISSRPDRGFGIFQLMTDRLANWSYFDPYYFQKLGKLSISEANQKVLMLKVAIRQRNSATIDRRAASIQAQKRQSNADDLSTLKHAFSKMFGTNMTVQTRGVRFEIFLREIFRRQSIQMSESFRLTGEEIDGAFKFEGENYIVEAKWQEPNASTSQLYTFAYKIDGKMHGRGLFISMNGFSNESIKAVVYGKYIKTMLMDGEDLQHIVEERISLQEMLDYKIRAAQTRGDVYSCAIRKSSKI